MWIALRPYESRLVVHLIGLMIVGIGLAMVIPLATALALGEWDPALDYALGASVTIGIGLAAMLITRRDNKREIRPKIALVSVAGGWFAAAIVAAIPLAFSGTYLSFLDALFDTMSGFTTSGLSVAFDLDHMSYAHNMWRHLTHAIGGQGIVVAALSLSLGAKSGGFALYEAEGRDERIMPSVVQTSRFIWAAAAVWLAVGSLALAVVNLAIGMRPVRAILHGSWLVMAAYDTGGFAPQSQNVLFYHAFGVEIVLMIVMLAGMLNFNLMADVLQGDRREFWKNIEIRTLGINILVLIGLITVSMLMTGVATGPVEAIRKGVYHIISAHSGTGHSTVYGAQWTPIFGGAGFLAIVLAMAFGGSVSSTSGGIKALRFGLITKALKQRVREAMLPRSAFVREKYHHIVGRVLTPDMVGAALTIFILYAVMHVTGGAIGALYGYPLDVAVFESVSAGANVGLTAGITSWAMPWGLKVLYIIEMWVGRLEFIGIFALVVAVIGVFRRPIGRPE